MSNEIHSSRVFSGVSRERLYRAFEDPSQVTAWWGPAGFNNTLESMDLRPGGKWRFTMHGPDGKDYEQEKTFEEVIPGEKVTFHHHAPVHRFTMELLYQDVEGGTRLDWWMRFEDAVEAEALRGFISNANEENFDRLQAYIEKNP